MSSSLDSLGLSAAVTHIFVCKWLLMNSWGKGGWGCVYYTVDFIGGQTSSMDMRHGHAAWTCGMDMQHGHAAWTCSMDIWTFNMDVRHGHSSRTCSMDMQHGHEAKTWSKNMRQGHAAWTCSMDMQKDMRHGNENLHKQSKFTTPWKRGRVRISIADHCCQIAENSAKKLKYSGRKKSFTARNSSGTLAEIAEK